MGVSYQAMLYVGKQFESAGDAEEFIRDKIGFTDEEEQELEEVGLQEMMYCKNRFNLGGECINCYNGYGFLLGTELSVRQPETFVRQVEEAFAKWNALFPDDPAEIIHTVKIY